MSMLLNCLFVFVGGGLGALSRFGVQNLDLFDKDKCFNTLVVNITGCLLIGILSGMFHYWNVGRQWTLFVVTGFLGGYTTFSSFSLDALQLVQNGELWKVVFYVTISIVGGLCGCALGFYGIEKLLKTFA